MQDPVDDHRDGALSILRYIRDLQDLRNEVVGKYSDLSEKYADLVDVHIKVKKELRDERSSNGRERGAEPAVDGDQGRTEQA
jgi:hypothetical protein